MTNQEDLEKILMTRDKHLRYTVMHDADHPEKLEMRDWCSKNCRELWLSKYHGFEFDDEKDYQYFILKWGQNVKKKTVY